METTPTKSQARIILVCSAVIIVAGAIRIWHDRTAYIQTTLPDIARRAREHPRDMQAQCDLGSALDDQHRFDEAETAYKNASELAPLNAAPLSALARIAMERYKADDAIKYMTASLRLDPKNAANWSSLGTMVLKRDPNAAQQAFQSAVTLDPNDAFSWLKLGTLGRSAIKRNRDFEICSVQIL